MTPSEAEAVFARLLPQGVAIAAMNVGDAPVGEGLAHAVPERRREFQAGRLCAARALQKLGVDGTVGRDAQTREPLWPQGVVGSITHTRLLAVAAVGRLGALGIDVEPQLSPEALADVRASAISDAEWALLGSDAGLATALFSAKESLFKCLWPTTHVFLDFPDVQLVACDAQTLTLEVLRTQAQYVVRYALVHAHALTASPGE